jgi:RNA-directed DNA polymerase
MMDQVNRAVRGWGHYFHYQNSSSVFSKVKMHVEERVRTQLQRRYQLTRAQAYARFPGQTIYERYGLYRLPTHAAWR